MANRTNRRGRGPAKQYDDKVEIVCGRIQHDMWGQAAEEAGAGSMSEWIRDVLDVAAEKELSERDK